MDATTCTCDPLWPYYQCPKCAHEWLAEAVDKAIEAAKLTPEQVAELLNNL